MENQTILSVENISVSFHVRHRELKAIRNVSLELKEKETLAIVGESGSGKSVLTKTFTGMLEQNGNITSGTIRYKDKILSELKKDEEWEDIRGKEIATIFQDPMTSLNPIKTIGSQISEVIIKHQKKSAKEAKRLAVELMEKTGIPNAAKRYDEYPFQYSGGMRQRIVIAIALACRPKILICDEPTTALDVTIQAQILELIKELQEEYQFTTIFITHDLGVVAAIADKVAVMYAGQIIESGTVEEIFYDPKHPYTWSLLSSLPQLAQKGDVLYSVPGTPPSLYKDIQGDAFAPRSAYAMKVDFTSEPPMFQVSETHFAKTWLLDPRAPKVLKPKQIENLHEKMIALAAELDSEEQDGGSKLSADKKTLLTVKDLEITFGEGKSKFVAVQDANFDIYKGETFSLVGESGSGKTTIGRAIIGLNPTSKGDILFEGKKINGPLSKKEQAEKIRKIQMIFQDPSASLNERATVEYIISEGLYNFNLFHSEEERLEKVAKIIKEVGLLPEHMYRYPHEFSGGQRQRIGIARALVMEPELVVADEPISALDVSIRAQVLNLLKDAQKNEK